MAFPVGVVAGAVLAVLWLGNVDIADQLPD